MRLRLDLTTKGVILVVAIVSIAILTVSVVVDWRIRAELKHFVSESQTQTLRIAANLLEESYPEFAVAYDEAGDVARIEAETLIEFDSHWFVDRVGALTDATATIFVWDPETRDFWRRTTNIQKPDGNRAVGTPLGQTGKVYPVVMDGRTYVGEATILGTDYFTVYEPFFDPEGETIGILYAGIETSRIEGMLRRERVAIAEAAAIALIGAIAAAIFGLRTAVGPLVRVIHAVRDVSAGRTNVTIPHAERQDEIGELARALRVFQDNAVSKDAQTAQIRQMADEIDQLARVAIGEVERQTQHMAGRLDSLTDSAGRLVHSAETVDEAAGHAHANSQTVAAATEELSASIQEIARQVQDSAGTTRDAVDRVERSRAVVGNLSTLGDKIGDVVGLIGRIAEQTNLLALNATIEASRAGDAGRGFAVVAGEVKSLAQQTARSTKDIEDRVAEISAAAREAAAAIEGVGGTIERIDEITASVAGAVEEQRSATEEIARSVRQSSEANANVAEEIGRVSGESRATTQVAGELKQEGEALLQAVRNLGTETTRLVRTSHDATDRRREARAPLAIDATVETPAGAVRGRAVDVAPGGAAVMLDPADARRLAAGQAVRVRFAGEAGATAASVVDVNDGRVGVRFTPALAAEDIARLQRHAA